MKDGRFTLTASFGALSMVLGIGCGSGSGQAAPADAATGDSGASDATVGADAGPADAPTESVATDTSSPEAAAADGGTEGGADDAGDAVTNGDAGDASPALDAGDASTDAPEEATCGGDSDPNNCGRCGHDCLGGTCFGGQCQPVVLFSGGRSLQGIAVDATSIYFGDLGTSANNYADGVVRKIPLTGVPDSGAGVVTLGNAVEASVVALDSQFVYWTSNATVYRTPIASTTPQVLASGGYYCFGAAVDATYLYCTDSVFNVVTRVPLAGVPDGGAGEVIVLANVVPGPSGIAVQGSTLFIAGLGRSQNGYADGVVATAGLDGSGLRAFSTGQYTAAFVAVNSSTVYWSRLSIASQHPGGIFSGPLSGLADPSAPKQIAPDTPGADLLVIDASNAYWNESFAVVSAPLTGNGTPQTIGTATGTVAGVAVDAAAVYWVTSDGYVWRVAKP